MTKMYFYHLKNIAEVQPFLSQAELTISLLPGHPNNILAQLQLLQNSAACLLIKTRKRAHITPILKSFQRHWLPVRFKIDFKILLLIYKSPNGLSTA